MKIPLINKRSSEPDIIIDVLRMYLHVFALLQKGDDFARMDPAGLADMLSLEEADGKVLRGISRKDIEYFLKKIITGKSGLSEDPGPELLYEIARVYSTFVIKSPSRDLVLKKFIEKHNRDCLWILAAIHFAILEKRIITFDYTTSVNKVINSRVHPYHLVFRNNNLYLLCKSIVRGKVSPIILSGIRNLSISEKHFEDDIPPVDSILNDTLSSFIGEKYRVTIRFNRNLMPEIEQMLSILEPVVFATDIDNHDKYEASFNISDNDYLCRQLFHFGSRVEIIKPPELRDMMIDMLEKSLSVYR